MRTLLVAPGAALARTPVVPAGQDAPRPTARPGVPSSARTSRARWTRPGPRSPVPGPRRPDGWTSATTSPASRCGQEHRDRAFADPRAARSGRAGGGPGAGCGPRPAPHRRTVGTLAIALRQRARPGRPVRPADRGAARASGWWRTWPRTRRTGAVFVTSVRTGEVWRSERRPVERVGASGPGRERSVRPRTRLAGRRCSMSAWPWFPQAKGTGRPNAGPLGAGDLPPRRSGRSSPGASPPGDGPHLLGDLGHAPDGTLLRLRRARRDGVPAPTGSSRARAAGPAAHLRQPADAGGRHGRQDAAGPRLDARPLRAAALHAGGTPTRCAPGDLVTAGNRRAGAVAGRAPRGAERHRQPRAGPALALARRPAITRWTVLARGPELADPTHVVTRAPEARWPCRQRLGTVHRRGSGQARRAAGEPPPAQAGSH